jgi:hypothetical protein
MKCTICRGAYYCSPACQKFHWKEHKKACAFTKEMFDEFEINAIPYQRERDDVAQLAGHNQDEFSFALSSRHAYNLFTPEGRKNKIYLTHIVVLRYIFDPHPLALRHCYTITSGKLMEKEAFLARLHPKARDKIRFTMEEATLRVANDAIGRKMERESHGRSVIRVPSYFPESMEQ